jgi:CheY-like chemotaxis protein
MLQQLGFEQDDIYTAEDGIHALDQCGKLDVPMFCSTFSAAERNFPVILMDVQMPRMDGIEATKELRRRGCTSRIIIVSSNILTENQELCREAGCDDYLRKPLQRPLLHSSLFHN